MIGGVAWEGPSPLTGEPIALVLTGPSANRKTGPMVQAWLLCRNRSPFEAVKARADEAICGSCVHRGADGLPRTCYVSLFNGPIQIWRTLQAGGYPRLTLEQTSVALAGHQVRVCAYGDPALLPYDFWRAALEHAGWVGYTHQWRTADPRYRGLLMASVESSEEADQAHASGWRTFRVRWPGEELRRDECVCPASAEAGHRTTCDRCRLCRGAAQPARSIAILAHGRTAAPRTGQPRERYAEIRADLERDGYSVIAPEIWSASESRLLLALKQHRRRRGQAGGFSTRKLDSGATLLWQRAEATS